MAPIAWALACGLFAGGAGMAAEAGGPADGEDEFRLVSCLFPPRMIRLGEGAARFTPSRLERTSRRLCARQGGAQRGGIGDWIRLAKGGNSDAQNFLGEMYENGTGGVAQDTAEAIKWYTLAAGAKNAKALTNLAVLYGGGAPGVARDADKADQLVQQAAATQPAIDTRTIVVSAAAPGPTTAAGASAASAAPAPVSTPAPTPETASALQQFAFGNYHALLIGNSNYRLAPKLKSPAHEVDVIGRTLERRYGFRVTTLKDATQRDILAKLDDLKEQLKPDDNLIVYFSGHGAESESREGYWIPVDGDPPTSANVLKTRLWIPSSDIRTRLSELPPRHVLLVSDSCYSGRFLQFRGSQSPANLNAAFASTKELEGFAQFYRMKSRGVLTSGGNQPVIDEADGSNMSLFARAFNQYLEGNRNIISSSQVFAAIGPQVMRESSLLGAPQQPQWGPVAWGGHEAGDFYFRPR